MLRQSKFRLIQFTPTTVYRKESTGGSYVDGVWVDSAETLITLSLKVQPAKEADMKMLPESERSSGMVKVFCQEGPLRALQQGVNGNLADEFEWLGYRYRVVMVNQWDTTRINHFECIAKRLEVTPN